MPSHTLLNPLLSMLFFFVPRRVLLPSNHVIVVPYLPDGTCEAHIRALNVEDIRQDRPGMPPATPSSSTYTVHKAGPEARERYEKRMAAQKLKREQGKREHGLVA